jgi:hypothetical protein
MLPTVRIAVLKLKLLALAQAGAFFGEKCLYCGTAVVEVQEENLRASR